MNLLFGAWVISLFFAIPAVSAMFGKQGSYAASYLCSVAFVALYQHYAQGEGLLLLIQQLTQLVVPPILPDQVVLFVYATVLFVGFTVSSRMQEKALRKRLTEAKADA